MSLGSAQAGRVRTAEGFPAASSTVAMDFQLRNVHPAPRANHEVAHQYTGQVAVLRTVMRGSGTLPRASLHCRVLSRAKVSSDTFARLFVFGSHYVMA
jgi:hypothetical protein